MSATINNRLKTIAERCSTVGDIKRLRGANYSDYKGFIIDECITIQDIYDIQKITGLQCLGGFN